MRLGILPAAGKSERWGGYPKELLPVSDTDTFLSRAVHSLKASDCELVIVVTSAAKVQLHSYHLKDETDLLFVIQQGKELWGAIRTAIRTPADEYCFMMPDTFIPSIPFPRELRSEFSMGLFETDQPERFGMVSNGRILDKEQSGSGGFAWGALAWKRSVTEFWDRRSYPSHTDAFNDVMNRFGHDEWFLDYYYDVGSLTHYAEFLRSENAISRPIDQALRVDGTQEPNPEENMKSASSTASRTTPRTRVVP